MKIQQFTFSNTVQYRPRVITLQEFLYTERIMRSVEWNTRVYN